MNSDLLIAIHAKFNGNANLISKYTDGLWTSKAETKDALPKCILTEIADVADYSTCTVYVEYVRIQFTAYASDVGSVSAPDFLLATADDLEATFNRQSLNTSNDTVLLCRKAKGGLPRVEDEKVFRIDLEYELIVQRNPIP